MHITPSITPPLVWIITDGKAGDENQCLGVVERLGLTPIIKRIAPRRFYAMLSRWTIDPKDASNRVGSPLAPPYPDIAIASGRRAVPYLRALKRLSKGRCFTVFLKDPRIGTKAADFIWVPAHDGLRGGNVLATRLSPHRLSAEKLAAARLKRDPRLQSDKSPRVALLLGGNSKDYHVSPSDEARLMAHMAWLAQQGAYLMATASRRSSPAFASKLQAFITAQGGFFWDGSGENPYTALIATADFLLVSAESTNMVGEALAAGKPVYTFHPTGHSRKIEAFLSGLRASGTIRPFENKLDVFNNTPLDATDEIAEALYNRYARHKKQIK